MSNHIHILIFIYLRLGPLDPYGYGNRQEYIQHVAELADFAVLGPLCLSQTWFWCRGGGGFSCSTWTPKTMQRYGLLGIVTFGLEVQSSGTWTYQVVTPKGPKYPNMDDVSYWWFSESLISSGRLNLWHLVWTHALFWVSRAVRLRVQAGYYLWENEARL